MKCSLCPLSILFEGLNDVLMSEDAATPTQTVSLEKFPLSSFDQLQKHGRIQCEKLGNPPVLLLLYLIQKRLNKMVESQ